MTFPESKLIPEGACQTGADCYRHRKVVDATAEVLRMLFDEVGRNG